jgi:hypothetical protein
MFLAEAYGAAVAPIILQMPYGYLPIYQVEGETAP